MLALSQATGIIGSMFIPFIAGKKKDQRKIVIFLIAIELVSLVGLLTPGFISEAVWITIIGFALGGAFGLALLFLVLRSSDTETATELSGMAQSFGYIVAATGPILIGSLFDYTGSWNYPIIALLFIAIIKFYMGYEAAKEGTISRV